jgi:hypothetical protein
MARDGLGTPWQAQWRYAARRQPPRFAVPGRTRNSVGGSVGAQPAGTRSQPCLSSLVSRYSLNFKGPIDLPV